MLFEDSFKGQAPQNSWFLQHEQCLSFHPPSSRASVHHCLCTYCTFAINLTYLISQKTASWSWNMTYLIRQKTANLILDRTYLVIFSPQTIIMPSFSSTHKVSFSPRKCTIFPTQKYLFSLECIIWACNLKSLYMT